MPPSHRGITFHGLRHTWASLAVMNGVPLLVVAKDLGHRDTRMVEHQRSLHERDQRWPIRFVPDPEWWPTEHIEVFSDRETAEAYALRNSLNIAWSRSRNCGLETAISMSNSQPGREFPNAQKSPHIIPRYKPHNSAVISPK